MPELEFSSEDRYLIPDKPLYQGAFSSLYKAQDLVYRRTVAIKAIDLTRYPKMDCRHEVTALCKFNCLTTGIPVIYHDFHDEKQQRLYIIMQWLDGETMRSHMDRIPNLRQIGINWLISLCDILKPLHEKGYEHHDLKPENIQIVGDNGVFLMDFNLSLLTPIRNTGTPGYAPPEMQADYTIVGRDKADIFSIGVILYELLTKTRPIHGIHYMANSSSDKEWSVFIPPAELNPSLPKNLSDVVSNCMKLDPRERISTITSLKSALIRARKGII